MPESTTHECPAPGCTKQVRKSQFSCSRHWFELPRELRSRMWSGYRLGNREMHARAMQDAVDFLNARAQVA